MPAIKRRPHPLEERPGAGAKQFALKTKGNPIGVAEYQLQPKLPADIKGKLPTAKQLAEAWKKGFVETQTTDPCGPDGGAICVNRGNAWDSYGRTCNATARSLSTEAYAGSQIGFRLARIATGDSPW